MNTIHGNKVIPLLYAGVLVLCLAACHKELPEGNPQEAEQDTSTCTFTVSYLKKVYFAPGNLATHGRTFVLNSWDYGGYFAWGTGNKPENNSLDNRDYASFYDWGDYLNYAESGWRTLGFAEWDYVLVHRKDAELKRGTGTVNGIHGLILLPDRWQNPAGIVFSPGCISWNDNILSRAQWEQMQKSGAVFLPASDYEWATNPPHPGMSGLYWTATPKGDKEAYYVCFYEGRVYTSVVNQRCYRQSVRLVRDVK